ncbi:MAG: Nif3-like dinuclear metal center hexameric protein [bacterium]
MITRDAIVSFLDTYLDIASIPDDSWNGLQYEGKPTIKTIVTAVDAGVETFQMALKRKADMIIVHHGQFWGKVNPSLRGWNGERLKILADNGISLYAAHLPLDRHPIVGNNAQLLKLLGARKEKDAFFYHGKSIGWIGRFVRPISRDNLTLLIKKKLFPQTLSILPFGPEKICTIGVCSGGGGHVGFFEALSEGVDAYISGDATEVYHAAKDARLNVFFAGHHATETVGVKALGEVLKNKFTIDVCFIDIPTGL